jgi:hypothetical protein
MTAPGRFHGATVDSEVEGERLLDDGFPVDAQRAGA